MYRSFSLIPFLLIITAWTFLGSCSSTPHPGQDAHFLSHFSYSGKYLDISGETGNARATFWKPDGSMLYVADRGTHAVVAYALQEPWEVHTATFTHKISVPGEFQHGLFLHPEGYRMWVFNRTCILSFTLAEAWDITSVIENSNMCMDYILEQAHDLEFSPDGSRLFIDDRNNAALFAFDLHTPWEMTTAKLAYTMDLSEIQQEVRGTEFAKNGTVLLMMDTGRDEVLEFQLSTPYDISTAVFVNTLDVSKQTLQGRGLSINATETSVYVTGRNEGKIFQYDLSTSPGQ